MLQFCLIVVRLVCVLCVIGRGGCDGHGRLKVWVNRMELGYSDTSDHVRRERYSYLYADGDVVEVWCGRWELPGCSLQLQDVFHHDDGTVTDNVTTDASLVGVRGTLRASHHTKSMRCQCTGHAHNLTIDIKLYLKSFVGALALTVQGRLALRFNTQRGVSDYCLWFSYKPSERVLLECTTEGEDVTMTHDTNINDMAVVTSTHGNRTTRRFEVIPDDSSMYIECEARRITTPLLTVRLYFVDTSFYLFHDNTYPHRYSLLALNITNSTLARFTSHDTLVVYKFDNIARITLNCSTTPEVVATYNYMLAFGDTVLRSASIVKQFVLSAASDNTVVECRLLDVNNVTVRQSRVRLHQNTALGPRTDHGAVLWATAAALSGVVVTCVVALVVSYTRKRRQTRRAQIVVEADHSKAQSCDHVTPMLPHPTQWDEYVAPVDRRLEEAAYSEVYVARSPGARGGTTGELVYAELDIAPSTRAPTLKCEESPYAEVIQR